MFDLRIRPGILMEINACRETFPHHYIRVTAFDCDTRLGDAAHVLHRQPARRTSRASSWSAQEGDGRAMRYTIRSYAADKPEGERY